MRKLVFIPTYNEIQNVTPMYRDIKAVDPNLDILFLDDHSPDGTGQILDKIAHDDASVSVLHRNRKQGIGSAHREGIRWAYDKGYDVLITMDCDFTHQPKDILRFLEFCGSNDVVIGSRYMNRSSLADWNIIRRALTHMGHFLTRHLLGMPYDATGALRLYRLSRIPRGLFNLARSSSYAFFFESLYVFHVNNFKIKELSIHLPKRTYGHSKMRLSDILTSVKKLFTTHWGILRNRKSYLYFPQIPTSGNTAYANQQMEWDAYWSNVSKKDTWLTKIYSVFATIFRVMIIKRSFNHFIRKTFNPSDRILHAGCGGGQVDRDVDRELNITALDISTVALNRYQRINTRAAVVHGSIHDMPFPDGSFDGLYNVGVMEHFEEADVTKILNEFNRVLKKGGRAMFFWPSVSSLSVKTLDFIHFILNDVLKRNIKLHPDEPTRVKSREHAAKLLKDSGFQLTEYYFGSRDLYTQAVVVCTKELEIKKVPKQPEASTGAIKHCRVCDSTQLTSVLSLGDIHVSDFLDTNDSTSVARYPLELVLCDAAHGCGLLQLAHSVDPALMYKFYYYRSGANPMMRAALNDIVEKGESMVPLTNGDLVLDIGCNDGTLLRSYRTPGIDKIGFEPGKNLIDDASFNTTRIINDYFNYDVFAEHFKDRKAKIITSIAMFYDLDNPNKFVSDIVRCLDQDGLWIIQMSYLPSMLKMNAFDNICHEHLEYYCMMSLQYLLKKHQLKIVDVEINDVNGGSFRVYVQHAAKKSHPDGARRVQELEAQEKGMGLDARSTYDIFAANVESIREKLCGLITREVNKGKTICVYGASTKGNTLLQYFNLDHHLITAAAECNPDKFGKKTIGSQIPIMDEKEVHKLQPDYFLILPWHFLKGFVEREKEYLERGGRFIVPLPQVDIYPPAPDYAELSTPEQVSSK